MIEDVLCSIEVSNNGHVHVKHSHPHDAVVVIILPEVPQEIDWVILSFFAHHFVSMAYNRKTHTRRGKSKELSVAGEVVEHKDNKKS